MHDPSLWPVLGILLAAALISAAYAAILNRIDYSPTYTWVTVVIGNAMIGGVIAAFCALGILPWASFFLLLAVNVAMGVPIIAWQIGVGAARSAQLTRRGPYATTHQGRPGAD